MPQYSSASDRYTQVYEMSTSYNWRYTTSIPVSKWYGYNIDNYGEYVLEKKHPERDCAVQCTYNDCATFPTYYKIFQAYDTFPFTAEKSMIGTGYMSIDFPYPENAEYYMSLGVRLDPRKTSSSVNKGNWSPDTYN